MRDRLPALLALFAACSVPTPPPPRPELPPLTAAAEDLTAWWSRFADADLDALLQRVLVHNTDLAAAAARVLEAAALVRNADDLLPVADLRASAGRNQTSDRNAFPRFAGIDRRNSSHAIALDVTWELDLWGRVRAANDAAAADLLQKEQTRHALRAALAAQAAQSYFRLVAIDRRLAVAEATLQNRQEALRIQQARHRAGTGTQLEVHQAEAELEAVAATLPRLRQAQQVAARALLLLAGDAPAQIAVPLLPRASALPVPPAIPAGLPADLLTRRADVRAAEAGLAAASARLAEAKSRYFPTIRLTATAGQESESLADLFTSPATIWNLAGGLTQPLLGLRKIEAQADAAEARRLQAEADYVRAVQTAFAEAYDALGARSASREALQRMTRREELLRAAERIAAARHQAGESAFLELLDAQRNLLAVQQERIDTAADELVATVDVYRALGGGWEPGPALAADGATGANR